MKDALKQLFASKKAILTLVAVLTWVIGKAGFHLEPPIVEGIVGLIALLVAGQSAADLGKERAKVTAAAATEIAKEAHRPLPPPLPAPPSEES